MILKKLKRKCRAFQMGFFLLLGILGFTVYVNYDYWVFKLLIANNYVFTCALDELYGRHIREEHRRSFYRDFDRVVISEITSRLVEIANDRHTYLYAPHEFQQTIQTDRAIARTAKVYALNNDTVYVFVPNISPQTRSFIEENREYMAQYKNLVLDLRGNYGGWIPSFHGIANLFVPRGAILSHMDTRLPIFTRTITSGNDAFFNFENIIVLQNRLTASSAEGLIMALSENTSGVIRIGQTSFGKGTGQVTVPLTGNYAIRATVLNVLGPSRQNIHNIGVAPDITIYDEDFIEKALSLLGNI